MNDPSNPPESWRDKAANIVPLVVFFVLGMVIDTSPKTDGVSVDPITYLMLVGSRVVFIAAIVGYFWRVLMRQFPLRVDALAIGVGVVGALLWIGICHLRIEYRLLDLFGVAQRWLPERDSVNPFATYDGSQLNLFLLLRFTLLAVCVPVAEELFLRGFVMRAFECENWTDLKLNEVGRLGLALGTAYAIASHPGEVIAAAVWFSLVSWMMIKTGKFWNCVLAHAVTNLILGIYIVTFSQWQLW